MFLDHVTLIAQHDAIDAATQTLLALIANRASQPAEASRVLGLLATLVRDHLRFEDPVIYETVVATSDTRHGAIAAMSAEEFARLKQDWTRYLARWKEAEVAADWEGFVADSRPMLERLRERVAVETMILYSLAEHYGVIDAGA